jgi:hypothetical protein
MKGVKFDNCRFTGGGAVTKALQAVGVGGTVNDLSIVNCVSDTLGGLLAGNVLANFRVTGCNISWTPPGTNAIEIGASTTNSLIYITDTVIRSNTLTIGGTGTAGIDMAYAEELHIRDCTFLMCPYGIRAVTLLNATISNCEFSRNGQSVCRWGILVSSSTTELNINNCKFKGYRDTTETVFGAIRLPKTYTRTKIINCTVEDVGTSGLACNPYGILVEDTGGASAEQLLISGCSFFDLNANGATNAYCIRVNVPASFVNIIGNTFRNIGLNALDTRVIWFAAVWDQSAVTSNNMYAIGNTGSIQGSYGVLSTVSANNITISDNNFAAFQSATFTACVQFDVTVYRVTITGNVMTPSNINGYGVFIYRAGTPGGLLREITISNNIIGNGENDVLYEGIHISLEAAIFANDARYTIANNTIRGFRNIGILVNRSSGNGNGIAVTGNVIESWNDAVYGMEIVGIEVTTIAGNSISLYGGVSDAKAAIVLVSCTQISISGNSTSEDNAANYSVRADTCIQGMFSGNLISCGNPGAGYIAFATTASTQWYVAANAFRGGTAGIALGGGIISVGLFNGQNGGAGPIPISPGVVGLNWNDQ